MPDQGPALYSKDYIVQYLLHSWHTVVQDRFIWYTVQIYLTYICTVDYYIDTSHLLPHWPGLYANTMDNYATVTVGEIMAEVRNHILILFSLSFIIKVCDVVTLFEVYLGLTRPTYTPIHSMLYYNTLQHLVSFIACRHTASFNFTGGPSVFYLYSQRMVVVYTVECRLESWS